MRLRIALISGTMAGLVWLWVGPSFGANPPAGERKAVVRVITRWNSDCDGNTRGDWDNMLDAWYDEIADGDGIPDGHGAKAWSKDGFYQNGNIVDSDFTDPNIVTWGNDDADDRLDEDDVCLVGLHGSESSDAERWTAAVRVDEAGDGNCWANQHHMSFGDTNDLEFLHISSCHSMCEDNWPEWFGSFNKVHQIDGFHGIMYIGSTLTSNYRDFGDDVFDIAIADAWLDNHYDPAHWYETWQDGDQCPVAYAVGTSENDTTTRRDQEEYDDEFSDVSNPTWYAVTYVGGCDPYKDPALPD
ncbi:MAG: hypothetical protein HY718_17145 [Planctomycetes bacterium]|nr:hypothetical protein [Planctomycetota bacterium]